MNGFAGVLFEFIALLASIFNYIRTRNRIGKWFLILLVLTNCIEWGNIFNLFTIRHSNNWLANIFNPLEFSFYTWLYLSILEKDKKKKNIRIFYVIYLLLTLINIFTLQGIVYFDSYSYITGCCLMVYCTYVYFKQILLSFSEGNILKNPFFWINTGVLIFYAGDGLLMAFFEYFLQTKNFPAFRSTFIFFNNFLNIILYSCLTIAFFYKPALPGTSSSVPLSGS